MPDPWRGGRAGSGPTVLHADGRAEIGRSEAAATGDMGHLVPKYCVSLTVYTISYSNFGAYSMEFL